MATPLLGALACVAAVGVPAARAMPRRPHVRFGVVYDCSYTTATRHAAPDVVFHRSHRYAVAEHHAHGRLVGKVRTGTFSVHGETIRFLTGPLQPPPGVQLSFFDTHHLSVELWQLRPAWVPWDCFSRYSHNLTFH